MPSRWGPEKQIRANHLDSTKVNGESSVIPIVGTQYGVYWLALQHNSTLARFQNYIPVDPPETG